MVLVKATCRGVGWAATPCTVELSAVQSGHVQNPLTSRPKRRPLSLTSPLARGLFFIQRYRFLTIDQFARAAGMNRATASNQLRSFETAGFLHHFGNTGLGGMGKTPKVYFLTRNGFELLRRDAGIPEEMIGSYKEIHVEARWSPVMYHRLRTVDLMIAAELSVRERPSLSMVATFLEYKRVRRGRHIMRETTDYVASPEISENRIIPDAAFIIENIETQKRALFFVEMDMATMRITSTLTRDTKLTLLYKISQYDRYLQSLRYQTTYAAYGDFRFFTLLFVTFGDTRVETIRSQMGSLPAELAQYYRFSVFDRAMGDLFGRVWKSRSTSDTREYALVREQQTG
jgi:hypothetical protein